MSDCSNHKKEVAGISDMRQLAEMIGDLHYKTLSDLLDCLGDKLWADASKDQGDGRSLLAGNLNCASVDIHRARYHIDKAWQISKPFMESITPQNNDHGK